MSTYTDEEGHEYRLDHTGRMLAVGTDHPQELADSLEMLARELPRTRANLHAWKWAVIAAHNAVQNIVSDCAAGDRTRERRELGKLSNRAHRASSEAVRSGAIKALLSKVWELIRRGEDLVDLHAFLDLFDLVNAKWQLTVPTGLRGLMETLNDERNAWIHFGAGSYEFEVDGYPSLLLDCLGWVEYLGWRTRLVFWFDDAVKGRARVALDASLTTLKQLVAEYS